MKLTCILFVQFLLTLVTDIKAQYYTSTIINRKQKQEVHILDKNKKLRNVFFNEYISFFIEKKDTLFQENFNIKLPLRDYFADGQFRREYSIKKASKQKIVYTGIANFTPGRVIYLRDQKNGKVILNASIELREVIQRKTDLNGGYFISNDQVKLTSRIIIRAPSYETKVIPTYRLFKGGSSRILFLTVPMSRVSIYSMVGTEKLVTLLKQVYTENRPVTHDEINALNFLSNGDMMLTYHALTVLNDIQGGYCRRAFEKIKKFELRRREINWLEKEIFQKAQIQINNFQDILKIFKNEYTICPQT